MDQPHLRMVAADDHPFTRVLAPGARSFANPGPPEPVVMTIELGGVTQHYQLASAPELEFQRHAGISTSEWIPVGAPTGGDQ
jgi:hypothetical protein